MREFFLQLSTFDVQGALMLSSLGDMSFLAVFLAVFFFGETAIIIALILSQQGVFDLSYVFVSAVLGQLCADAFWFLVGRYFPQRFLPDRVRDMVMHPVRNALTLITKDRIFLSIFFLKFFIGVRLAIVLYLAHYPITFVRFFIYNVLGTLLYMIILSAIGVLFGSMLKSVLPAFHLVTSVVSGIVLILLISFAAKRIFMRVQEK